MKVVHCVGWYPPDSFGGTERYVDDLARSLKRRGCDIAVMAARDGLETQDYEYHGYPVVRYPVPPGRSRAQLRGRSAHDGLDFFKRFLAEQDADIYHQHSWSLGCGMHHLRTALELGIPAVLTVHVPANICPNGTMMRGEAPCDGRLDVDRCSCCLLAGKGTPAGLIRPLLGISRVLDTAASQIPGRIGTLLDARNRVSRQTKELSDACDLAERVVVVAEWLRESLLINGVPPDKIVLCRHGIESQGREPRPPRRPGPLRVGFLGRWDRVKGVDTLVSAVRAIPDADIELRIHAMAQGSQGAAYQREVMALACGDRRIHFLPSLEPEQVADFLYRTDVLAVPSRWLETGPLVALESLAAGTPVLGSALGGLKEWIVEGENGWLVPQNDVKLWAEKMAHLAAVPTNLNPAPPHRTIDTVAASMEATYSQVLSEYKKAPRIGTQPGKA